MRIALDASALLGIETGGARYARQLINKLLYLFPENEYTLLFYTFRPEAKKSFLEKSCIWNNFPNVKLRPVSLPRTLLNFLWEISPALLPIEKFAGGCDIFHSLGYSSPRGKVPVLSTIYDLTLLKRPDIDSKRTKLFYSTIEKTIRRTRHLIAISQNTKNDLVSMFNIPENKISVTYLAADESFYPNTDKAAIDNVIDKYGISSPYLLYVGTMGMNKNISALIKAYRLLRKENKFQHKLVICGKKTRIYPELKNLAAEFNLEKEIIFTGYVPDEDLPFIYNGAEIFLYMSLYEGFGLPVLEAMSCGKPVIASGLSSIPEIVEKAGVLVNPDDIEQIAAETTVLLSDEKKRTFLGKAAFEQSKKFSFEKCARETMDIYRKFSGPL